MKIMQSIEEHPYIAAGGVFVLGVILIVILFSGGSTPAATVAPQQTDTSSATQLAMAQIQAQALTTQSNNALAATQSSNAAAVSVAQIQGATQQNYDAAMQATALGTAQLNKDAAIGTSTIEAQALNHASDNALQGLLNTNASTLQAINIQSNAQTVQNAQSSQIALAIAQTQAAAAVQMNANDDYTKRVGINASYGISGN